MCGHCGRAKETEGARCRVPDRGWSIRSWHLIPELVATGAEDPTSLREAWQIPYLVVLEFRRIWLHAAMAL